MRKGLDERGVEPLAMKILAGIVLFAIGLGIGYGVYIWARGGVQQTLSFTVTVSPGSCTIGIPTSGENTKTISVSVEKIGAYDKTVALTATGQPTGVTVSFSPASGKPTFGSTMTITVSSEATPGTTTLTVRATGEDTTEQTGTLELTLV